MWVRLHNKSKPNSCTEAYSVAMAGMWMNFCNISKTTVRKSDSPFWLELPAAACPKGRNSQGQR